MVFWSFCNPNLCLVTVILEFLALVSFYVWIIHGLSRSSRISKGSEKKWRIQPKQQNLILLYDYQSPWNEHHYTTPNATTMNIMVQHKQQIDVLEAECSKLRNMFSNPSKGYHSIASNHNMSTNSIQGLQGGRYCPSNDERYGPRQPGLLPPFQHWTRRSPHSSCFSLIFMFCKSIRILGFF